MGPAEKIEKICQKLSLKLYCEIIKVIVYLEGMALC